MLEGISLAKAWEEGWIDGLWRLGLWCSHALLAPAMLRGEARRIGGIVGGDIVKWVILPGEVQDFMGSGAKGFIVEIRRRYGEEVEEIANGIDRGGYLGLFSHLSLSLGTFLFYFLCSWLRG